MLKRSTGLQPMIAQDMLPPCMTCGLLLAAFLVATGERMYVCRVRVALLRSSRGPACSATQGRLTFGLSPLLCPLPTILCPLPTILGPLPTILCPLRAMHHVMHRHDACGECV
jgi:hypothetical protein